MTKKERQASPQVAFLAVHIPAALLGNMLQRPSSRILLLDDNNRLLLFRFEHKNGPLTGQTFWATPGGALDAGETFEDAAVRELYEETGLKIDEPGPQIAERLASFAAPTGEMVEADERYFLVRAGGMAISRANWTELEHEVMATHRWWSQAELQATGEVIWPENVAEMLVKAGAW